MKRTTAGSSCCGFMTAAGQMNSVQECRCDADQPETGLLPVVYSWNDFRDSTEIEL